jgi:hypothetical protein
MIAQAIQASMNIEILRVRIRQKASVDHETKCWNWTGQVGRNAKGVTYPKYNETTATRMSYRAFREEPPDGIFILHLCDNRWCVNPHHLVRADDLKTRIMANVAIDPVSGCWNWTGSLRDDGYGRMCAPDGPEGRGAHILSFEAFVKPVPHGFYVCHRCDNHPCVNPDHLFLGDHADNMKDMVSKGRQALGIINGQAKLSESQAYHVHCIHLHSHLSTHKMAHLFDVRQPQISRILSGKRWPHIKARIDAAYSQQE